MKEMKIKLELTINQVAQLRMACIDARETYIQYADEDKNLKDFYLKVAEKLDNLQRLIDKETGNQARFINWDE